MSLPAGHTPSSKPFGLTPREIEVLRHLVSGRTNKEVGRVLGIGFRTVECHRANVRHKTGAMKRPDLVRLARDLGLEPV